GVGADRALVGVRWEPLRVVLDVVERVVLGRRDGFQVAPAGSTIRGLALEPVDPRLAERAGQERVLPERFVDTAPARVAIDVDRGGEVEEAAVGAGLWAEIVLASPE